MPKANVVDPLRIEIDGELLKAMISMQPSELFMLRVIHPTLARHLRVLEDGGFKTDEVQRVDMFALMTVLA